MAPLAGKHVLVIGGSSGIGFAVARAALAEGARVTIASSSEAKVKAAAKRLGGCDSVRAEVLDVSQESAIKAFFEKIETIDHLVFSAGGKITTIDSTSLDLISMRAFLEIRYFGFLACARYGKGRITDSFTVTTGTTAVRPIPAVTNLVGGGGAAIAAAAQTLAIDLAPVRANCIAPGLVLTELWDDMPGAVKAGIVQNCIDTVPLKRAGTPEEVAEAYLFAMKCTYLTGQTILADGGAMLV